MCLGNIFSCPTLIWKSRDRSFMSLKQNSKNSGLSQLKNWKSLGLTQKKDNLTVLQSLKFTMCQQGVWKHLSLISLT